MSPMLLAYGTTDGTHPHGGPGGRRNPASRRRRHRRHPGRHAGTGRAELFGDHTLDNIFKRWIMKRIVSKAGGATDVVSVTCSWINMSPSASGTWREISRDLWEISPRAQMAGDAGPCTGRENWARA